MKRILFAVSAFAIASAAALTPANAQVYLGADPGGAGVQVGPVGAGAYWDGRYHDRYSRDYGYARDCRVTSELSTYLTLSIHLPETQLARWRSVTLAARELVKTLLV